MSTTFAHLGIADPLERALSKQGIETPFPIQEAAIPEALSGRDIRGKAPTGSGKTLAFGLPLLQQVGRAEPRRPRALVLAPTRELAEQITIELRPLAGVVDRRVAAVYGGVGYGGQISALRKGLDVLVATPGRLEDLLGQNALTLNDVDIVVIDEADRMADMGFLPAVRRILDQTSAQPHTMLFSATLDGDVAVLSRDFQSRPVHVEVGNVETDYLEASHHFWRVHHHDRVAHTADVIRVTGRSIVFTRTRHGADRLTRQLGNEGIEAVAMHGGRSQTQRTRALRAFSTGKTQALIATDVAARGIHVDDVATVIHYDLPTDHKDYLHRSGRTARAGAGGTVVSLIPSGGEEAVRRMQRALDLQGSIIAPRVDLLHQTTPRSPIATRAPRETSSHRRSGGEMVSIYVGNLPWKTTHRDLETLFGDHGHVSKASVITDRASGRSKGYGFVDMAAVDGALAIETLQGARLGGRPLKIRLARP
ncbi:MAG: DEAD/DEAH box helicase [Actinobacteria bacterium]|nr:DEAD/DEAH box helicase [Actinomycetota bacterium]